MSDLDSKLTDALNADPPPARDPWFRLEVLLRIERARFKRRIFASLIVAVVTAALVALTAQSIEAWIDNDIWHLGIVAAIAVAFMFTLSGIPIEALPGFGSLARACRRWLFP